MRVSLSTKGSFVKFGKHPMAKSIQALDLAEKAVHGELLHRARGHPAVRHRDRGKRAAFEGYIGKDRKAKHLTFYTPHGV